MKKNVIEEDIRGYKQRQETRTAVQKYNQLMNQYVVVEKELNALLKIKSSTERMIIEPTYKDSVHESVAFAVASDWHIEEKVDSESVNGYNQYNLEIAQDRVRRFYQNTLKLVRLLSVDTKIETLVIPHLGDLISGGIHEELLENCLLRPIEAAILAKQLMHAGLNLILNNSKLKLIIPCSCGNHSRINKRVHYATEAGNSLEYFIYKSLESEFSGEKRIQFIVNRSYHTYVNVFNKVVRMHHGHAIRYAGGVGGIYIPVNKAIAQWNRIEKADYEIVG